MRIWPLFGTTNQLLASLTLLVISVMLLRLRRPVIYVLVPLAFVLVMATWALLDQMATFWGQRDYLLLFMDVLILGATILVALEAFGALQRARNGDQGPPSQPGSRVAETVETR